MGEMWKDPYENDAFEDQIEELWHTLLPLYEQFHAYIRRYSIVEINVLNLTLLRPKG